MYMLLLVPYVLEGCPYFVPRTLKEGVGVCHTPCGDCGIGGYLAQRPLYNNQMCKKARQCARQAEIKVDIF